MDTKDGIWNHRTEFKLIITHDEPIDVQDAIEAIDNLLWEGRGAFLQRINIAVIPQVEESNLDG